MCKHPIVPSNALNGSALKHAQPTEGRLPALTGVRILAALAVYASHLAPPHDAPKPLKTFMESGYMGVTLFFTLSGFVLTLNYFESMRNISGRKLRRYAVARLARIYPLYILIVVYFIDRQHAFGESIHGWWEHVLAIQAWDPNVYQAYSFDPPSWSISVEFFLYACFPLLILALARVRTPRATLTVAAVVALMMAALTAWFVVTGRGSLVAADPESAHRWLYVTPLTRLGDFTLGILTARLFMQTRGHPDLTRIGGPLAFTAGLAIVALMAWPANLFSAWSLDLAYALPAIFLIFGLAVSPLSLPARTLSIPIVVLLGEASYAFYLVHMPALGFFGAGRWAVATSPTTVLYEALTLGAILCFAVGLHVMVERPARLYIRRLFGSYSGRVSNPAAIAEPDTAVTTRTQPPIV
jgi:peptidoglycan/LPS O-acetylase OafA/YrhL